MLSLSCIYTANKLKVLSVLRGIFKHDGHAVLSGERMVKAEMDGVLLESVTEFMRGSIVYKRYVQASLHLYRVTVNCNYLYPISSFNFYSLT